jgi:hypothetical protein
VYAPIRQGKAKTGVAEELARRIKEGVAYAPDDPVTAITKQPPMSSTDHAGRKRRPGMIGLGCPLHPHDAKSGIKINVFV